MKENLILLTATFPYGNGEAFLETELPYLAQNFSKVIIIPTKNTSILNPRSIPKNCIINESIISKTNHKKSFNRKFSKLASSLTSLFFYREFLGLLPKKINKKVFSNLLNSTRDASLSKRAINDITNSYKFKDETTLIYSYWCTGATLGASLSSSKFPVISRVHRGDLYEELFAKNYIPYREKIISNIEAIFSISEDGINYLKKRYPTYESKLKLSRLGIPVPKESLNLDLKTVNPIIIVSCSSINRNKSVDRIALSLSRFAKKHSNMNIIWHHFGTGPDLNYVLSLIEGFPENLSAKLHGHIDNKALLNWYSKNPVNLFINLSKSEGIPVSIMEANSYGIPAIATNVGGTSELVKKESGWLLKKDFTDAEIQSTLQEAFFEHKERSVKGNNAHKICSAFFDSEKNYPEFNKKLKKIMFKYDAHKNN
jgi:glycosyltransferase involved in cell wall biosynthesis